MRWLVLAVVLTGCAPVGKAPAPEVVAAAPLAACCTAPYPIVSTVTGSGTAGQVDGAASEARFQVPYWLAFDPRKNLLYVSDRPAKHLRAVAPDGTVSSLPGTLPSLGGITVDGAGNVYATDPVGNRIYKTDADGVASVLAGDGTAGTADGKGSAARFNGPEDLVAGPDGSLYVTDLGSSRIRKVAPDGTTTTLAVGDPALGRESFQAPTGITIDEGGALYFSAADTMVHRLDPAGQVRTLVGGRLAFEDGPFTTAQLNSPWGLTYRKGHLYVADLANQRIRDLDLESAIASTLAGDGMPGKFDGPAPKAQFRYPTSVAFGPGGALYVADQQNAQIRKIEGF